MNDDRAEALPAFNDPRVQVAYEILCSDNEAPDGEHWEGFAARRIVAALEPASLTDERIDHIADLVVKGMPEGISGFCKSWGWRQFARAILADCAGHVAEPAAPAARSGEAKWRIEFADPRDFCRYASLLIGAAYISAEDALTRFKDGSLWGERTHGTVTAALAAHQPSQSDDARCRDTYETTSGNTIVCKTCGACWPLGAATACENARNQLARAALASQKEA